MLIAVIIVVVIITNIISNSSGIANAGYSATTANTSSNLVASYIKKGITIGGVTGTLESLDTSDATATAMDIAYGEVAYARGERIVGMYVNRGDVQVGDYVAYTPDIAESYSLPTTVSGYISDQSITQNTSLTWRVLSVNDDGTINIITSSPVNTNIYFRGALGYNNCVYVLNDLCASHYSNSSLGVTARSINLENDIESKMNEEGINTRNSYGSGMVYAYGTVTTWTNNKYYPSLFVHEKGSGIDTGIARMDGIEKNDAYFTSPTNVTYAQAGVSLTAKSDEYYMSSSETPNYFNDKIWYQLAFGTGEAYWLASRCVFNGSQTDYANFGLRYINGGDGSEEHPYQLSK